MVVVGGGGGGGEKRLGKKPRITYTRSKLLQETTAGRKYNVSDEQKTDSALVCVCVCVCVCERERERERESYTGLAVVVFCKMRSMQSTKTNTEGDIQTHK